MTTTRTNSPVTSRLPMIVPGCLALGVLVGRFSSEPTIVRAEKIEIVDSQGNVKAWLGTENGQATLVLAGEKSIIGLGIGRSGDDFLADHTRLGSPKQRSIRPPVAGAFVALSVDNPDGIAYSETLNVDESRATLVAHTGRSIAGIVSSDDKGGEPQAALNLLAEQTHGAQPFVSGGVYVTRSKGEVLLVYNDEKNACLSIDSAKASILGMNGEEGRPFGVHMDLQDEEVVISGAKGEAVRFP